MKAAAKEVAPAASLAVRKGREDTAPQSSSTHPCESFIYSTARYPRMESGAQGKTGDRSDGNDCRYGSGGKDGDSISEKESSIVDREGNADFDGGRDDDDGRDDNDDDDDDDDAPADGTTDCAESVAACARKVAATCDNAEVPNCPICLSFFCEPVRTHCNHIFCRVCLLQTTQLSPDGRACPLCRSPLKMENPCTEPVDRALEKTVRASVPSSEYELRLSHGAKIVRSLKERARTTLPIFYMSPGCRVGQPIALHLFEPRYRILIRRAMEGNYMFVYAARTPKRGDQACLVKVTSACFHRDGRANIIGVGIEEFGMEDVWVEEGTAGLYYTRFVAQQGGFDPANESDAGSMPRLSSGQLSQMPRRDTAEASESRMSGRGGLGGSLSCEVQ